MKDLEKKYLGKLGYAVCTDGKIYQGRAYSERIIEEFMFVKYEIRTPWKSESKIAIFRKEKDGSLKRIRSEELVPPYIEVITEGNKKKIKMGKKKIIDPEEEEQIWRGFF